MNMTLFLREIMLPLRKIDEVLPSAGIIYEIGSGWGVLGHFLADRSITRTVICIDTNKDKIRQAQEYFKRPNLIFEQGNASEYRYQPFDGMVMSDFLHHVNYKTQERILKKVIKALKKNGVLVIKEIDKEGGMRMWLSRMWDFIFYPRDTIFYREKGELSQFLRGLGCVVKVTSEVRWFPGSTYLFVCRKK